MLQVAKMIGTKANERGWKAFIVGGFVRDFILGKESKDLDIEIFGPSEDELVTFLSQFGIVNAVGKSFGVFKLRIDGIDLDVSLPRTESKVGEGHKGFVVQSDSTLTPKEAAMRRDFTFNALMMTLPECEIVDFFSGQEHLENKRLVHTSSAFSDDPLRVLRGMQFCGRFNLTAEQETVSLSRSLIDEFDTLSKERIWIEFEKWAAKSVKPSRGLVFLLRTGWINRFPEIAAIVGVKQGSKHHPEGSVWQHIKRTVDKAAKIADREGLAREDRVVLVLSGLLHDTGKATMSIVKSDKIVNSTGHDIEGVKLAKSFLESINAPNDVVKKVCVMVQEHMNKASSHKAVRRLANRLDCVTIDLFLMLVESDCRGRKIKNPSMRSVKRIKEIAQEIDVMDDKPKPILMGRHLIDRGMRPGKEFGIVLRAAFEAQLDGVFDDIEGAQEWLVELVD